MAEKPVTLDKYDFGWVFRYAVDKVRWENVIANAIEDKVHQEEEESSSMVDEKQTGGGNKATEWWTPTTVLKVFQQVCS